MTDDCTCSPGQLCDGCADLLLALCREPDPLARIAAGLGPIPKQAA